MKYRSVGKSGLKISEVALGSWVTDLKGTAAEDVAKETVELAYDSGVNFFDCADAYSGGAAERFLGKTLKQYPRKELVISSKVYFPTGEGVNDRGLSRKHIFESIDQTLKNMQTDYLDMYFCHRICRDHRPYRDLARDERPGRPRQGAVLWRFRGVGFGSP